MSLLTAIFLVPMQSALVGLKPTNVSSNVMVDAWPDLPALGTQGSQFTGEPVNQAMSIISRRSSLPWFTTEQYAVSPLRLVASRSTAMQRWNLSARIYWAEASCFDVSDYHTSKEPDQRNIEPGGTNGTILYWRVKNVSIPTEAANFASCSLAIHDVEIHRPKAIASVYPTWNKINKQLVLSDDTGEVQDPRNCTHLPFLASLYSLSPVINGTQPDDILYNANANAFLCKAEYFSGLAEVSVTENGTVTSLDDSEIEQRAALLDRHSLDIDTLEDSISNDHHEINGLLSLDAMHTFVDVNTVTMGSVIRASLPESKLVDSQRFKDSIERAYRLVAVLAFARALRSETPQALSGIRDIDVVPTRTSAIRHVDHVAIAITTPFAIALEILLGCLTAAATMILISCIRRKNLLRNDPDSLAAIFALVLTHVSNITDFGRCNTGIDSMAASDVKNATATLTCQIINQTTCPIFRIRWTAQRRNGQPLQLSSKRPFYLRPSGILLTYSALTVTMASCALLLALAHIIHFTYLAETNSLASQALWQLSPTLAATIIGAMWTVVHRDLSVLEPWVHLRSGAPAATTLSVNYGSRTPYTVLFKAGRKRHAFLSFVSLVCVTTSILNIATGGLFSQASSAIQTPVIISSIYGSSTFPTSMTWNATDWNMVDAFELVRTNISDNTPVPPWSTRSLFFWPVTPNIPYNIVSPLIYNITTIAIGASLDCETVGATQGRKSLAFGLNTTGTDPTAFTLNQYLDGTAGIRQVPKPNPGLGGVRGPVRQPYDDCYIIYGEEIPEGPSTTFMPLTAANIDARKCGPYLSVLERIYKLAQPSEILYGTLCWPRIDMYDASVIIDRNNRVQSYKLRSTLNDSTASIGDVQEHVQTFLTMLLSESTLHQASGYHGMRVGRYDWPGLLTARMRNLSHPDGAQDSTILAAAANQTFAQTFASFWALYSDQFLSKAAYPEHSTGEVSYQLARMVPSIPAFTVTFALLVLYIIAATAVFVKRRKQVTPRVPNSLGTILPWIVHSRILRDFKGTTHLSSELRDEFLRSLGKEYRFGWFRDEKGLVRLGIEESRYVMKEWVPGERRPGKDEVPVLREGSGRGV